MHAVAESAARLVCLATSRPVLAQGHELLLNRISREGA
jgi:hypothetical protein